MTKREKKNKLKKVLGVIFGTAVVVGGTIGAGILRVPGTVASILPDPWLILACWIVIGLFILLSASSYAELTTMLPKAGGAYNYIKLAFGDYAGFVNGWFDFICNAIAPAYFCMVLSGYCSLLFNSLKGYETLIAIFFLTLFLFIHLPGVRSGSLVQRITSAIKIVLFLSLITGCFLKGPTQNPAWHNLQRPVLQGGLIFALLRAIQLILGTYDGWMAVSFFAEEDSNPGRNIPKSYLIGALTIAILYIAINAAILYVLPVAAISKSTLAASDAARIVFGNRGSDFMILISIFSLISILNAYMMIPSRILYGLSRDGFFVSKGTTVNKGGTPYYSLLFCYLISISLVLFSSFERLFSLGAFLLTIVGTFAFASLIILRKKEPNMARPYKAWGYPYSTYFACLVSLALVAGFAIQDQRSLFISAMITILSIPIYRLFVKKQAAENPT